MRIELIPDSMRRVMAAKRVPFSIFVLHQSWLGASDRENSSRKATY